MSSNKKNHMAQQLPYQLLIFWILGQLLLVQVV